MGTNLSRLLASKQKDFEIIDIKVSNQFPEKCKIADIRDINSLRKAITGDIVVHLAAVHAMMLKTQQSTIKHRQGKENGSPYGKKKELKKLLLPVAWLFMVQEPN